MWLEPVTYDAVCKIGWNEYLNDYSGFRFIGWNGERYMFDELNSCRTSGWVFFCTKHDYSDARCFYVNWIDVKHYEYCEVTL